RREFTLPAPREGRHLRVMARRREALGSLKVVERRREEASTLVTVGDVEQRPRTRIERLALEKPGARLVEVPFAKQGLRLVEELPRAPWILGRLRRARYRPEREHYGSQDEKRTPRGHASRVATPARPGR